MTSKNVVTIALLLFVAASIVVLAVKSLRENPRTADPEPTLADGVIAYYFHGKIRCPTCRRIETYAHEAVRAGFAKQLAGGRLRWQVVDYELPENRHFATDYELAAPTVVLVETSGGGRKQWKNLDRVWELVGDKEAFVEYVRRETRAWLEDPGT
jgi:hypothetical protein